MASSHHQQPSINPNTGYCSETKTFHSIRPKIPLPSPTLPLTSASHAYSLYLSSSSPSSSSSSNSISTVPALIDSTTSIHISYSQFFDRIQILSSFLQTHFPFLTNGQIAFVLSPSTVHLPVLYFSLLSLGMVVSPSNPASSSSEVSRQIQLSSPVIAFATSSTSHKLPSSLPMLLLDSPLFLSLFSTSSSPSSDALRRRHHLLRPTSVRQSDPAAILYSSGTTGNVKGVVLTHRNLMSVVAGMYAVKEERAEPAVLLLTVPMFHAYGFVYCLKAAAMGETVVVVEGRFAVGRMMKAVEEFGVTHVVTAPPVVVAMANGDVADRYAVRSLERMICGGAPLRRETIERFKARFPNVLLQQGYGLTETTAVAFRMVGPEEISHLGSVGRLVPYCEAKIVDPGTGITESPCKLGELWIRGPMIMKDIYNYCKENGHWKYNCPIRPNRQNNNYSRTSQKQNFRGSAYAPPQQMHPSNRNQSHWSKQYATNTTNVEEVLSTSQIQSMIDERMQQLFLASSSTSPMAASPSDPGPAMTMFGASGYVGDESATAATINSDGWLKTGDLCYMDSDGFLFVVDRLKELIKYKGYQVPPAELEQLLLTHPEITEAAVIPYPDEEAGQVPMAFVVRRPNSYLNEAQIMEFIARQVAPYKKIRRVSFINSIPKNPSGKLLRKDLVKLATSSSGSPSSRL